MAQDASAPANSAAGKNGKPSAAVTGGDDQAAYEKVKKSLQAAVERKAKIERELEAVEDRIYVEEGLYLQDATAGNIAKGFDYYTKSSQNRRRATLTAEDRVFSNSSVPLFEDSNMSN